MFMLIETVIENNGSYDGDGFAFDTEVSYQDVRLFSSKEEAIATAKAEAWEKKQGGLFTEDCVHDTLTYESYSKDFSGPEKIVTYKVIEIPEKEAE